MTEETRKKDLETAEDDGDLKLSADELKKLRQAPDDDDDDSSSDEEDDDLILEGVLVRNPEVPSSSDSENDDEQSEESPEPAAKKQKRADSKQQKSKSSNKKKGQTAEPDIIHVDFTYCDMDEKFFHGIKILLHSSSTVYAPHSSSLTDLMIENVAVGTVISTEGDEENNVYGFASVLNVTTYQAQPCIQELKKLCLNKCPEQHRAEMETVLSGKTRRPAGFLLHSRMANLPLELVEVLHQQLVLDMDWAVENAAGGEEERKSLDFGAFVRIAPAYSSGGGSSPIYKYFDDEIFATNAEFVFLVDAPKAFGTEQKQLCSVIVMSKTGHRAAMQELTKLVKGS